MADPPRTTATPIGARTAAYLDALKRENIPADDVSTLLRVADGVCARRGDTTGPAQADRLMAAFPGQWTPRQAAVIAGSAIRLLCGGTALHGVDVSMGLYPEK